jgi:hypothetical protein
VPKISSYPNNSSPDNAFEFIGTDPDNETEGSTGTTETVTLATITGKSLPLPTGGTYPGGTTEFLRADQTWAVPAGGGGGSTVWHDLVGTYGADPTGTASASTALATACTAAVSAQPASFGLTVPPGNFLLTAPQQLPWNMVLQGAGAVGGDVSDQFTGTWFKVSSSFSGGAYVFGITDNANHTSANGCLASSFAVDGSAQTGTAVSAFLITGPALTTLQDIYIAQMSGWAINTATDPSASEIGPYGQTYINCTSDSCGVVSGGGFNFTWCEDSVFTGLYSIGNGSGPGFYISECDNTKFTACNSEWNDTFGYYITGNWQYATGGCQFSNISTDSNTEYGFYVDATWTTGGGAGTGPCVILVNNMFNRRDGQGTAEGTGVYAGIGIGATTLPIIITGFAQMTNIGDGGAGTMTPNYGIYFTQDSYSQPILISNGLAWGYTHPTYFAGGGSPSGTNFPTGVTSANILLAHGNNYAPTYGS